MIQTNIRTVILMTRLALVLLGAAGSNAFAQCDFRTPGCQRQTIEGTPGSSTSRSENSSRSDSAGEARQRRRSEALAANDKAIALQEQGEYAKAVMAYQEAADKAPDDEIIRENLANAKTLLVRQLAREQAARDSAEAKRRDKAAADNMQQSIQDFAKTLKAAPSSGGLDFDGINPSGATSGAKVDGLDFTTVLPKQPVCGPLSDPMVVNACNVPSGLPQGVERAIAGAYKDAPPGVTERVSKGFQSVMTRDWKVAKAWFEDALNHDPTNLGIKRLAALCDYTYTRPKPVAVKPEAEAPKPLRTMSESDGEAYLKIIGSEQERLFAEDFERAMNDFYLNYVPKHPELKLRVIAQPGKPMSGKEDESTIETFIKRFQDFVRPPATKKRHASVSAVRG